MGQRHCRWHMFKYELFPFLKSNLIQRSFTDFSGKLTSRLVPHLQTPEYSTYVNTVRWRCLCPISISEPTAASSGYHGNTRHPAHVRFVKEALYFSECSEYLETPSHTSTYCAHSFHPHITVIKLSPGPDDKDDVTVCDLLCQRRK